MDILNVRRQVDNLGKFICCKIYATKQSYIGTLIGGGPGVRNQHIGPMIAFFEPVDMPAFETTIQNCISTGFASTGLGTISLDSSLVI